MNRIKRGIKSNAQDSLRSVLRDCGFSGDTIDQFRSQLDGLGSETIDHFLEHQPQYRDLGRAAIAGTLMPLEQRQKLRPSKGDWCRYLVNELLVGGAYNGSRLTVLTFNYDRSFEEAMCGRISDGFNITVTNALQQLTATYVYHLHGHLGELPGWPSANNHVREYGGPSGFDAVRVCMRQIRIVGDEAKHKTDFEDAHVALKNAEVICFLGFKYHQQSLLDLRIKDLSARRIFGTASDLRDDERNEVQQRIPGIQLGEYAEDSEHFLRRTGVLSLAKNPQPLHPPPYRPTSPWS